MTNAVQTIEQTPVVASYSDQVMVIIDRAARDPAVNIERLQQLLAMKERIDAEQSRKDFNAAVSAAKGEIKPIAADAQGHNKAKYASFGAIAEAVDPILAKHGLSYRFRTSQADRISVTCILSHVGGHCEESTLTGPPDVSGNKNNIQAIGSTLTYLQRYSLVQSLGLAVSKDDDGEKSTERDLSALLEEGEARAEAGPDALQSWWTGTLTAAERKAIGAAKLQELKTAAQGQK